MMTDELKKGPRIYSNAVCCNAPHVAFGLCSTCYQKSKRGIIDDRTAQIIKDHGDAKIKARFEREATRKAKRKTNFGKYRCSTLKRRYGISSKDYDELLASQNFTCAICQEDSGDRRLYVDHDHKSNTVRELLCPRCNQLVGSFENFQHLFVKVADYLTKHRHPLSL